MTTLNRRDFLKSLGVGVALSALSSKAWAIGRVEEENELLTLLDVSKCVACGACVEACREVNGHKYPEPEKPFPEMIPKDRAKPEDWSENRREDGRLTPYNWLYIQEARGQYKGKPFAVNIPRRCLHCQNPPCANLCPWGSAYKLGNGIVRIDPDTCLGGAKCKMVCPWSIPQRQTGVGLYKRILPKFAGNGVMFKCDRCYDRVVRGKLPACIEACPFGVQSIGRRPAMIDRAKELARSMDGFIYGLTENGGTNTLYVSPVPFDVLNASVETGPGMPGLDKAPDLMAKEHVLGMAVMLAPVAGAIGGFLKLGSRILKKEPGASGEASHE